MNVFIWIKGMVQRINSFLYVQQCQSEKIEVPKADDLSSKATFGFVSMSKDTFLVLYFFSSF